MQVVPLGQPVSKAVMVWLCDQIKLYKLFIPVGKAWLADKFRIDPHITPCIVKSRQPDVLSLAETTK